MRGRTTHWSLKIRLQAHSFSDRWSVSELKHLIRIKVPQNNLIQPLRKNSNCGFLTNRRNNRHVQIRFEKKKKLPETASMKQKGR